MDLSALELDKLPPLPWTLADDDAWGRAKVLDANGASILVSENHRRRSRNAVAFAVLAAQVAEILLRRQWSITALADGTWYVPQVPLCVNGPGMRPTTDHPFTTVLETERWMKQHETNQEPSAIGP